MEAKSLSKQLLSPSREQKRSKLTKRRFLFHHNYTQPLRASLCCQHVHVHKSPIPLSDLHTIIKKKCAQIKKQHLWYFLRNKFFLVLRPLLSRRITKYYHATHSLISLPTPLGGDWYRFATREITLESQKCNGVSQRLLFQIIAFQALLSNSKKNNFIMKHDKYQIENDIQCLGVTLLRANQLEIFEIFEILPFIWSARSVVKVQGHKDTFWNLAIAFYGYPEIRHYGRWRYCKRRTSSETEGKDLVDKCARSIVAIDSSIGSFFSL